MAITEAVKICPEDLVSKRETLSLFSAHCAELFLTQIEAENDNKQAIIRKCSQHGIEVPLRILLSPMPVNNSDPNEFFDQIFILNLEQRPDRWEHMVAQCRSVGIWHYQRFTALYGKEEPHYSEWKKYTRMPMTSIEKNRYQRRGIQSCGSFAILKAMYLMLRQASECGYRRILVFQDDLLFHKNFRDSFARTVNILPDGWRLWYLGATQHSWNHTRPYRLTGSGGKKNFTTETTNNNHPPGLYHPNGTADGAFGVAIDHTIFEELMNLILEFKLPVDSGPLKTCQRKYADLSVVSTPNLVIADIRDSDLRNSRDLQLYSERFRWDLSQYEIVDSARGKNTIKITGLA